MVAEYRGGTAFPTYYKQNGMLTRVSAVAVTKIMKNTVYYVASYIQNPV